MKCRRHIGIRDGVLRWLSHSKITWLPVPVYGGLACGAWWSLYPCTSYWRGTHEIEVQKKLANWWDWRGKTVWDLGSHFGLYAVGLGLRVGPTGSVVALEPNPASYARLVVHVHRNRLSWVKPIQKAASDVNGPQRFYSAGGQNETVSHLAYEGEQWNADTPTIAVETCRLDDLVRAGQITRPDFIKVDVEGHGHKALAGAVGSIEAKRPVILIGFHSPQEVSGVETLLGPLGYKFTPIQSDAPAHRVGCDFILEPR